MQKVQDAMMTVLLSGYIKEIRQICGVGLLTAIIMRTKCNLWVWRSTSLSTSCSGQAVPYCFCVQQVKTSGL